MLGNEFKARLQLIDLNQSSFASAVGVQRETVNRWINQKLIPDIAVLALECLERRYKEKQTKPAI